MTVKIVPAVFLPLVWFLALREPLLMGLGTFGHTGRSVCVRVYG